MRGSMATAGLGLVVVYALTLCPTVYVEGSGELIGAAYLLGTPHPSGYPLYCLLARLFAVVVRGGNPAHTINLFTAASTAATGAALAGLLRARGLKPAAALAGAFILGCGRTLWSQAVIAEVYGLAMLFLVLSIWAALRVASHGTVRRRALAGYIMGMGLTTHLSQVLLWPGLLVAMWPGGDGRASVRRICWTVAGMVCGYSLVLYLPLRNHGGNAFHWGDVSTPALLWNHLSGALYRSSFFSLPVAAMAANAARWGDALAHEFHPLLLPVCLFGGIVWWRRDRALWLVTAALALCDLFVVLNYHRDPNGIDVFFLPSFLVAAIWTAAGVDWVARRSPRWVGPPVAAIVVLVVAVSNWGYADRSHVRLVHDYGSAVLADLPRHAVLLTEGDDASFVVDYLWRMEGKRPDVTLYNRQGRGTDLLNSAERLLGERERSRLRRQREADLLRTSSRPVCLLIPRRIPARGFKAIPRGMIYRLVPSTTPQAADFSADVHASLGMGTYRDPWLRKLQGNYWFMCAENARARGALDEARKFYERAAEVAFDSRTMQYNVALSLLRCGDSRGAQRHARAAVGIDPWMEPSRRLLERICRARPSGTR